MVLRHAGIGLYYAGRKHWVGNADSALDLETVERATALSHDESFGDMDILVTYGDDSGRELALPVRRKVEGDQSLRETAWRLSRRCPLRSPHTIEALNLNPLP